MVMCVICVTLKAKRALKRTTLIPEEKRDSKEKISMLTSQMLKRKDVHEGNGFDAWSEMIHASHRQKSRQDMKKKQKNECRAS